MSFLNIIILVFSLILSSCSSQPDNNTSQQVISSNIIASIGPVSIHPVKAVKGTVLNLKTESSLINDTEIQWLVDGFPSESADRNRFNTHHLKKGNTVSVVIIKGDKEFQSNDIIIGNSPPAITNAKLYPELPTSSSTLTVKISSSDIDNDHISHNYKWYLNDEFAGNDSYLETEMKRGDTVTVEIAPTDREDTGKSVTLTSEILNAQPVVSESTPVIEGNVYRHSINVSDPDGDTLTFTLKKSPEGMSIDQSGVLTWELQTDDSGDHDIEVLISDNQGSEILVPISTSISF